MTENITKVYEALVTFEYEGLSYEQGVKYEFADEVVALLPEGSVKEFVSNENPDGVPLTKDVAPEVTPKAPEAKPWAGNHTVGRE